MKPHTLSTVNGWTIYRVEHAREYGEPVRLAYAVANGAGYIACWQTSQTWAEGWANVHDAKEYRPSSGTFQIHI